MTDKSEKTGRRKFLKILGGGVIVAVGAGGLFVSTRTPSKAIEPWKLALGPKEEVDPRRIILSHAILAPNPHNRQPWIVDLEEENQITLYCDLDRRLPHTDPYDRQITIGLGCFLELAILTTKEIGMKADLQLFPEGENFPRLDQKPVARITLAKDAGLDRDPLFAQILERRSNKDVFDISKSVSEMDVMNILSSVDPTLKTGSVTATQNILQLRALTKQASTVEMNTHRTHKESIDLMRMGKAEINANPDGIDMGGAFLETLSLLGQLNKEDLINPESTAFKQSVPIILEPLETAMGYVFVKTQGNSRKDQIQAGRGYVRMNLKATQLGIAMHPVSQALQEYEEIAAEYQEIRKQLGVGPQETLQMFARIGYGEKPNPSPRWNYEAKIRSS